ncbi:hypothetical protein BZF66_05120 [Salmonella enterica]|nr:hypothetical protein [Salmonella enterica]ECV9083814.1 hypothetical protein [Salmonella enterica subsp. enterica serovar Infantis]MCP0435594.1 hypothetical protein [Salmonella enterica subsp. enterica serovar Mbandaka]QCW19093.1 hypothetical protein 7t3_0575 [Salmonella phage 7t3]WNV47496.1 peptidyl-tRNA hydrolase [Klebsiella phage fENko-Kae01]
MASQIKSNPEEIIGKAYILLRKDLEMPEGKLAAQAGHAMDLLWDYMRTDASDEEIEEFDKWHDSGRRKIILRLKDESDMIKINNKLIEEGFKPHLIYDYGINFFDGLTFTGLVLLSTKEVKTLKRVRVY